MHTLPPQPDEFRPAGIRASLLLIAQIAGLFGTGWMVWHAVMVPRLDRLPLAALISEALQFAALAWAWSAAMMLALLTIIPRPARFNVLRNALHTSATAVWFAPATILLTVLSPAALAAALILVVSTTRLLYSNWRLIYGDFTFPPPDIGPATELFEVMPAPWLIRQLVPALILSFGIQAGMLSMVMGYALLASALFCLSAAMLTLWLTVEGLCPARQTPTLPRSILGVLLTIVLACGLTVGGLSTAGNRKSRWDYRAQPRPGIVESTRALVRSLLYGNESDEPDNVGKVPVLTQPGDSIDIKDDSYPGVILWPEVKPVTTLVAPTPAMIQNGLLSVPAAAPLSIPFSGEYWMFKPPNVRPPRNSFVRRGSPLALSFMTTDHRAMLMEAHHKLEAPIDFGCCSQVQLVLSNRDRFPSTISLELILIDNRNPGQARTSLGRAVIRSAPDLRRDPVLPVTEVLSFPVKRNPGMREFNEIAVVFHREFVRADRSAKVSIERFVLVPRS